MDSMTSEEPAQGFSSSGSQINRTFSITELRDGSEFRDRLESAHAHLAGGKAEAFCIPFPERP